MHGESGEIKQNKRSCSYLCGNRHAHESPNILSYSTFHGNQMVNRLLDKQDRSNSKERELKTNIEQPCRITE